MKELNFTGPIRYNLCVWSFDPSNMQQMSDCFNKFGMMWNCSQITGIVKPSKGQSMNSKLIIFFYDPPCDSESWNESRAY